MLNSSLLPLYCSKYDMQSIWSVVVHFCSLISESNNRKCFIRIFPFYTYVESYLSLVFEHDTFCEFGSIAFRPSALYMNWIPDYLLNGFYICTRDPLQRWSGHSSEKHFHTNQKNWTPRSNERTKSVKMSKQRDTKWTYDWFCLHYRSNIWNNYDLYITLLYSPILHLFE